MQDSNNNTPPIQAPTAPVANSNISPEERTLDSVVERIKQGDNILVALSKDPTVDELVSAIAITLYLDKYGKHATAIFSGKIPNAIEFLKPEETLADNTDSLQDFIIALNKEKADHLRYKLEGDFVRVYISPYKTKISKEDLEFSYGDFNVDLAIAINVSNRHDLDAALTEYGRITHDATSINILAGPAQNFGEIEWSNPAASSVSEMFYRIIEKLDEKEGLMDPTIANALLTGIVASTQYFSNSKTTSESMGVAAQLMSAGADQQLIAASINTPGYHESKQNQQSEEHTKKDSEEEKEEEKEPIITIPKSESSRKHAVEHKKDSEEKPLTEDIEKIPESLFAAEEERQEDIKPPIMEDSPKDDTVFSVVEEPALPPNPFQTDNNNKETSTSEETLSDNKPDQDALNALDEISNNSTAYDLSTDVATSTDTEETEKESTDTNANTDAEPSLGDLNFEVPTLPENKTELKTSDMEQLDAAITTPAATPANETSFFNEDLTSELPVQATSTSFEESKSGFSNPFADDSTLNNNVQQATPTPPNETDSGLNAFFPPPPPPPIPTVMPEPQLPNVSDNLEQKTTSTEGPFTQSSTPAAEPPSISSFQIPDTGEDSSIFSSDNSN